MKISLTVLEEAKLICQQQVSSAHSFFVCTKAFRLFFLKKNYPTNKASVVIGVCVIQCIPWVVFSSFGLKGTPCYHTQCSNEAESKRQQHRN